MFETESSDVDVPFVALVVEHEELVFDTLEHFGDKNKESVVVNHEQGVILDTELCLKSCHMFLVPFIGDLEGVNRENGVCLLLLFH